MGVLSSSCSTTTLLQHRLLHHFLKVLSYCNHWCVSTHRCCFSMAVEYQWSIQSILNQRVIIIVAANLSSTCLGLSCLASKGQWFPFINQCWWLVTECHSWLMHFALTVVGLHPPIVLPFTRVQGSFRVIDLTLPGDPYIDIVVNVHVKTWTTAVNFPKLGEESWAAYFCLYAFVCINISLNIFMHNTGEYL